MMKKWLCFILSLLLALCAFTSSMAMTEEEARKSVNTQAIRSMLDVNEYNYTYVEDGGYFTLTFTLESTLNTCKVWIVPFDDSVRIQADYEVSATKETRDEMAIFCTRISNDLRVGHFYMDYDEGLVGYEVMIYTEEAAPTQKALDFCLTLSISMAERYGEGVANILFNKYTAEDAYALCKDMDQ